MDLNLIKIKLNWNLYCLKNFEIDFSEPSLKLKKNAIVFAKMWSGASEERTNLQIEVENLQDFLFFVFFSQRNLAAVKSMNTHSSEDRNQGSHLMIYQCRTRGIYGFDSNSILLSLAVLAAMLKR